MLGVQGKLPPIIKELKMKTKLLQRVVGSKEELKVVPIKLNEPLILTVGIARTVGIVTSAKQNIVQVNLKMPICCDIGQRVAISRQISGRWRLIGYGETE